MAHPTLHDWHELESFRRRHHIDPDRIRRMQYALYQSHEPVERALQRLGSKAQTAASELDLAPLQIVARTDSQLDLSTKFVLSTWDAQRIETVVLCAPSGRAAVCVSTQVGCRAGCTFCATARMGLRRNLTAAEIVEQVLVAARDLARRQRRLRNVVFMGMGEPLDNEYELHAALRCLQAETACRIPPRRLSVSTVGVPAAMLRLVEQFPGIQLALSLHSARQEVRQRLIPWARRADLAELHQALQQISTRPKTHRHQGPVMIEYIMIAGVTDTDEDASALADFLRGLDVHINLIPYNQVPGIECWQPTDRARRDEFAKHLRGAGIFTTIRYSMGADIRAACGQLAQTS